MTDRPNRLKELRRSKGWTAKELAEKVGVHQITIFKYESGAVAPSIPVQFLIARIFGLTVDDVFPLDEVAS